MQFGRERRDSFNNAFWEMNESPTSIYTGEGQDTFPEESVTANLNTASGGWKIFQKFRCACCMSKHLF
jgi:hypothetical protein